MSILPAMALPADLPRVEVRPITPSVERRVGLAVLSEGAASPAAAAFMDCAITWARTNGYLP